MQSRGGLARSAVSFGCESGHQLTGFGREMRTIPRNGGILQAQVHPHRTLHLGNVNVPPSCPAIEGSEDGGGRRAASSCKKGPSTSSSAPHALPGRKEPGQSMVPGKHGRQLWVRFGGGCDTRGWQPHRIFILRERLPIPRCCDRHLILYWRAK